MRFSSAVGTIPTVTKAPRYEGLRSASVRASDAARGSSKKRDTRCELVLRKYLHACGCRFRKNVMDLPGKPDVVFSRARIVVFCDGDFWHGRDWEERRTKLSEGSNARYWVAKIERNIARDLQQQAQLEADGWTVVRLWERDVLRDVGRATEPLLALLRARSHFHSAAHA